MIAFVAGGYQQLDTVRGSVNYANIAVADWCDRSDLSLSLSASGQQWHPVLSCSQVRNAMPPLRRLSYRHARSSSHRRGDDNPGCRLHQCLADNLTPECHEPGGAAGSAAGSERERVRVLLSQWVDYRRVVRTDRRRLQAGYWRAGLSRLLARAEASQ